MPKNHCYSFAVPFSESVNVVKLLSYKVQLNIQQMYFIHNNLHPIFHDHQVRTGNQTQFDPHDI